MALQFREPPEWLIQEYMNRKSEPQQILDSALQAGQLYGQLKNQRAQIALKQQEVEQKKQEFAMKGRENFIERGDVEGLPVEMQSMVLNPAQGPATAEGVGPQIPALAQRYHDFFAQNPQGLRGTERTRNVALQESEIAKNLAMADSYKNNPRGSSLEKILAQKVANGEMTLDEAYKQKNEGNQSFQIIGTQDGTPVAVNSKTLKTQSLKLPGTGPLMSTAQSEGQANAKTFAQRMEEADAQLNNQSASNDLSSIKAGVQGSSLYPNIAKPGNIQMFEQSKRNFLNAVLRRESGAVISPTEFAEGNRQYFTVMGDTPEVQAQKTMNRRTAIEGLRNAAGGAPSNRVASANPVAGLPQVGQSFEGGKVRKVTRIQ